MICHKSHTFIKCPEFEKMVIKKSKPLLQHSELVIRFELNDKRRCEICW